MSRRFFISRRSLLRVAAPSLLSIALTFSATTALAVVLGITSTPPLVVIGRIALCFPNTTGNQDPIASTTWRMREHYPAGITLWQGLIPDSKHQVWFFARAPITYELELVTKYSKKGPGHTPPKDTTHKRSWPIDPADGVRDFAGFGQNVGQGGSIVCVYQIRSGTEDTGPYLIGTVQERLRNRYTTGVGAQPDLNWMPLAPSPSFHMDFGKIYDQHAAATQF